MVVNDIRNQPPLVTKHALIPSNEGPLLAGEGDYSPSVRLSVFIFIRFLYDVLVDLLSIQVLYLPL